MSEVIKAPSNTCAVAKVIGCNLIVEEIEKPESSGQSLLVDTSTSLSTDYKVAKVIKVGDGYEKGKRHDMPCDENDIIVYSGNTRSLNFGDINFEMISSNNVVAVLDEIRQS